MWLRCATVFGLVAALTSVSRAQSVDDRAELRRLYQDAAAAHERKDYSASSTLRTANTASSATTELSSWIGCNPPVILRLSLFWIR